jgi:hypothetical protein
MIKPITALVSILLLAACASSDTYTPPSDASIVEGIKEGDETTLLVRDSVDLVRRYANPLNNNLGIQQAPDNVFTPSFIGALRNAGFGVGEGKQLIYQIGPIDEGIMLRLTVDSTDAARLYVRNKEGVLEARGPVTVRTPQEVVE